MSAAGVLVDVLVGALPAAIDLVKRELAGQDVKAEAAQLAANVAYKLGSQQVHLAQAERDVPGFKR